MQEMLVTDDHKREQLQICMQNYNNQKYETASKNDVSPI